MVRRKPKSVWSKVNKEKVERLIDQGLMIQAGYESIERAKQNGSWTILDDVEELIRKNELMPHSQVLITECCLAQWHRVQKHLTIFFV